MKLKIIFITLILFNLLSCDNAAIYKKIDYADDELYVFLKQYIEILEVLNQNHTQENSKVDVQRLSKDEKFFANFVNNALSQKLHCQAAYRKAAGHSFENLKYFEINKILMQELSNCTDAYQNLINSMPTASQTSFGMIQFASALQDIQSYQDLTFLNYIQSSIFSKCFRRVNNKLFLMNLSEEQFQEIKGHSNSFVEAMLNSGDGKFQFSHPNNSSDVYYREWKLNGDMNGNGVTYNHLITIAQSLYFMPGDYVVCYLNKIKNFNFFSTLKVDFTTYYGGFFSFVISSICWFVMFVILESLSSFFEKLG